MDRIVKVTEHKVSGVKANVYWTLSKDIDNGEHRHGAVVAPVMLEIQGEPFLLPPFSLDLGDALTSKKKTVRKLTKALEKKATTAIMRIVGDNISSLKTLVKEGI